MKNNILKLLIISLVTANTVFADYSYVDSSDFTGDAFFTTSSYEESPSEPLFQRTPSLPPLKKLRVKIKKKLHEREMQKNELAPTAPADIFDAAAETSQYASHEIKDDFDDSIMPDGFEADEETISETNKRKHFWQRKNKDEKPAESNDEDIVLDCQNIDYDTDKYCIVATGDVSVNFVKQGTTIKADVITYDRINNTIKAEGNVRILKGGQTITGDYIFVDMNEENALIENPIALANNIVIKSQRGYVYGDKIVQENGSLTVDKSIPINFRSQNGGPWISRMILSQDEEFIDNKDDRNIRLNVRDLKITQKGDLEVISLKRAALFKGNTKIIKLPSAKIYTNKNLDFVESSSWELGSLRGLGMYIGPSYVFEIPGGSVLKAMPILNYNSGFGIGGIARYSNASNWTQAAYGTAKSKFLVRGQQKLDDNLSLEYVMNDYMKEWFLGRRRAKYGASLVYDKSYSTKNFLRRDHDASYRNRLDFGYYQDIDSDSHYKQLNGNQMGTIRVRYMAEADQNLFSYVNKERRKAASLDVVGQMSAALYGTGDTQVIGRIGPRLHTQYRRWMQDVGYFQSVYDDNTPMPVFDAYRYGKSNLYLREYFKLCKYITVSWFGSINLSGDSPNNEAFQENAFYVSFGPEDIKFSIGYDIVRETTRFMLELMMDAKGTGIDFEKMEIKQDKKAQKKDEIKEENDFQTSKQKPVLKRAVVENVKNVDDVL